MADNYIKMWSISLVSRQIQIKNHAETPLHKCNEYFFFKEKNIKYGWGYEAGRIIKVHISTTPLEKYLTVLDEGKRMYIV